MNELIALDFGVRRPVISTPPKTGWNVLYNCLRSAAEMSALRKVDRTGNFPSIPRPCERAVAGTTEACHLLCHSTHSTLCIRCVELEEGLLLFRGGKGRPEDAVRDSARKKALRPR